MNWETGFIPRALVPVSWIYGAAAVLRREWQTRNARGLPRPVVSVGNVTCGGTGKTPMVEMVARDLLHRGLKPAILSRGYGASRTGPTRCAGTPPPAAVNDEFLVLGENLPEVPHFQGKDRHAIGLEAIAAGAGVLVLDDGFQHTRLARDLDIVLIDAIVPFGHGRVLPAGLLREPLGALSRAHLLGITRSDLVDPKLLSTLSSYLRARFHGIPQVFIEARPLEWMALDGKRLEVAALRGKRVMAFCGIGNPEAFRRQLLLLGVDLRGLLCFRDHHRYTGSDIEEIGSRARELGAEEVVMTQKDAVKIPASPMAATWKQLRIAARLSRGEEAYEAALKRLLEGARSDAR